MPLIIPIFPKISEDELSSLVDKYMIDDILGKDMSHMTVPFNPNDVFFRSQLPESVMVLNKGTYAEQMVPNIVVDSNGKVITVNF